RRQCQRDRLLPGDRDQPTERSREPGTGLLPGRLCPRRRRLAVRLAQQHPTAAMGADPRPLAVVKLGRLGIWSGELRFLRDRGAAVAAVVELEEMGYDAIWLPGGTGTGTPIFDVLDEILNATRSVVVASGIISIWVQDAAE